MLKPHLGRSLSLLSTSVKTSDGDTCAAGDPREGRASGKQGASCSRQVAGHAVAAPWILPSGAVHWPTLHSLVWQVQCTLAANPGIPEETLAGRLDHALGQAHLVMLLQRMEALGLVRAVTLPMFVDCVSSGAAALMGGEPVELTTAPGLWATASGLVPSIFAGGEPEGGADELRVLPLVAHYFSDVGTSLQANMEQYGQQAWK